MPTRHIVCQAERAGYAAPEKDRVISLKVLDRCNMVESAREVFTFVTGKERADLDKSRMLTLSLLKSIEIIGEAASKVTAETRDLHKEIPWEAMVAMRNRLIHGYFDVDLDRVWDTVREDLPALVRALEEIIMAEGADEL